jgi:hypothetical protein
MPPTALNGIGMCASIVVNETDAVVNGLMRVTLLFETIVCCPTIPDDRSAWFDPRASNSHQSFSGSFLSGNKKRSTRTTFHTTKYPQPP